MGKISGTISDTAWKWRCKLGNLNHERTLADYKTEAYASSSDSDPKDASDAPRRRNDTKDPGPGSTAAVKTFYESPESDAHNKIWVDYPPRQPSKKVALAQGRVAFRLYKVKDMSKPCINGKYALKHHMIDVQNAGLIAALKPILEKEEDVHLDPSEQATFHAPFRPLYFCYDKIVAKCNSLAPGDPLQPFMLLFIRVMDEIFADLRHKKKSLQANGLVSYATAWSYFKRDEALITQGPNCQFLCKVISTEYRAVGNANALIIKAKALKFTGEAFVWVDSELKIDRFAGNKPITELDHYPLEFHADPEGIKKRMEARGRLVLDYQGLTYCNYEGLAIFIEDKKVERHNVEGRILVDVVGFNKHHLAKGSREGEQTETEKNTVIGTGRRNRKRRVHGSFAPNMVPLECEEADEYGALDGPSTGETASKPSEKEVVHLSREDQERNKAAMLAEPENLMYMSPLLQGFALKNKEWLSFFVEDIRPMVWNDKAYEHLVYPEEQKDLVLSFVESHKKDGRQEVDDVIIGKGQGLIMLLSGPPGTGKTLMAEAVADRTHRPLFYLQAEDLGISAATLGANLKKVFTMATEWNAVILLDEADVFLAERHPTDIARNELVSIFLRELEYFRGIIFLTTNLYQTIDTAFRSRVSLHLLFNPLTTEARVQVWRKFLDRIPASATKKPAVVDDASSTEAKTLHGDDEQEQVTPGRIILDEDDIQELGLWNLNGREIKNAVKMAKNWCDHKGYDMTLSRVENSIKVTSPHASRVASNGDADLYD
ncbi:aaa family ATPase [Microdochium trichocladiopsis]|uniref:Aaa family ATPase n=1 Tax=Microdochium trichocladiopsis TaxID=1682393 RepID=A0A9P8Y3S1_9PEZI|nr:aaa family ATPase [Microdochium trichocladiopsis]KAH7029193.1 aaa family ATPase [Microdochium trichocladiopsis]